MDPKRRALAQQKHLPEMEWKVMEVAVAPDGKFWEKDLNPSKMPWARTCALNTSLWEKRVEMKSVGNKSKRQGLKHLTPIKGFGENASKRQWKRTYSQ